MIWNVRKGKVMNGGKKKSIILILLKNVINKMPYITINKNQENLALGTNISARMYKQHRIHS